MSSPTQFQLLRVISQSGPMSRTTLAEVTGLSKASVSMITRDLLERGVLHETETVQGQGRPSIKLGLDADSAYFVGVSLIEEPFALVVTDLHGVAVATSEIAGSRDPAEIGRRIKAALPGLLGTNDKARARLRGVGIAVPGFVDERQQVCLQSTGLGWQDLPVAGIVSEQIGLPVAVENDANAVTLAETLFGRMRGCTSFALVSVGEGIGCGLMLNGELYRGQHGGAGEISHATIELGGTPCRCGKRGCLDTISSLSAIRSAAELAGLPGSLDELERLAGAGRLEAVQILHRAGSCLGLAIAHLIQMIDPEQVVIAHLHPGAGQDPGFRQSGLFETVTRQAIEANVLPRFAGKTVIHTRRVSKDVWAQGAASVAAHHFLFGGGTS